MTIKIGLPPVHPGDFIKTEIVDANSLSITHVAKMLGVSRQALSSLLNEHSTMSVEMAIRMEKVFGVSRSLWLRMQSRYDTWHAEKRTDDFGLKPFKLPEQPEPTNAPQ